MIAQQDYELAEQLMNADLSFQHDKDENGDPDYPSITKKVYHLEAIFLDLTDRTQAHPKVPFATEVPSIMVKVERAMQSTGTRRVGRITPDKTFRT